MISLEQIRLLQDKVKAAVTRIDELKNENDNLKRNLETHLGRIEELEDLINDFKNAQTEIEQGIVSALNQLDQIEDDVVKDSVKTEPQSTTETEPRPAGEEISIREELPSQGMDTSENDIDEPSVAEDSDNSTNELDIF